jgi:hypothetical protein
MNKLIVVLMLCISLFTVKAFAEDLNESYLRTSVGIGVNYAGTIGINNEYVFNEYFSAQAGVGYKDHIDLGVIGGLSLYPIKNNQYFYSPRISALYGRIGRILNYDGSYDQGYGYALAVGCEYPMSANKKWRGNFDVYYVVYNVSVKNNGRIGASAGIGYSFQ